MTPTWLKALHRRARYGRWVLLPCRAALILLGIMLLLLGMLIHVRYAS